MGTLCNLCLSGVIFLSVVIRDIVCIFVYMFGLYGFAGAGLRCRAHVRGGVIFGISFYCKFICLRLFVCYWCMSIKCWRTIIYCSVIFSLVVPQLFW